MSSRKRASRKDVRNEDDVVIPKEEFVPHSIDPEEADAYWIATCNMTTPLAEAPYPARSPLKIDPKLPSKSAYSFLNTIRKF